MRTVIAHSGTVLRVAVMYHGLERQSIFYKSSILVGRAHDGARPEVDLSPDVNVSRSHARIWLEDQKCFIEDCGSKFGTTINGSAIPAREKRELSEENIIGLGETTLQVRWAVDASELPHERDATIDSSVSISQSLDAGVPELKPTEVSALQLSLLDRTSAKFDTLLRVIIRQAVEDIPEAWRGTLLLHDAATDRLLVAAFVSDGEPAASETLARRAMNARQAFIWRRELDVDLAHSVRRHRIESGMYAPLVRGSMALGAISVDNPYSNSAFGEHDLRRLLANAQEAAIAVASHQFLSKFTCQSVRVAA